MKIVSQVKPVMTRKLRRRPNDPVPEKVEKRRKPPPAQVNYLLDEKEIESDLKAISRGKVLTAVRKPGELARGIMICRSIKLQVRKTIMEVFYLQ